MGGKENDVEKKMTGKIQLDEKNRIASGHHISPSPKPAIESSIFSSCWTFPVIFVPTQAG